MLDFLKQYINPDVEFQFVGTFPIQEEVESRRPGNEYDTIAIIDVDTTTLI